MSSHDLKQLLSGLPHYLSQPRLLSDLKRLLGISPGWLSQTFSYFSNTTEVVTPKPQYTQHSWVLHPCVRNFGQLRWLCLTGHVITNPKGKIVNVPVCLWLPPEYPCGFPLLFVLPSQSTRIVANHPHVGMDGRCYFPYLSGWNPMCTIEDILGSLIQILNVAPALQEVKISELATEAMRSLETAARSTFAACCTFINEVAANAVTPKVNASANSNSSSSSAPNAKAPEAPSTATEDVTDMIATEPGTECAICLENKKCAFFLPCGHVACCMGCGRTLKVCCICRSPIQQTFKAYV